MSGGGGAPARGRMGQSVAMTVDMSPSEMGRMEQAVTELEGRVRKLRNRTQQLEGTIETLTRDVKLWSTDLNKFKVEVDVSSHAHCKVVDNDSDFKLFVRIKHLLDDHK